MAKNINIELTDEDFEELKRIKEHLGTTWEHMLKKGWIKEAEEDE